MRTQKVGSLVYFKTFFLLVHGDFILPKRYLGWMGRIEMLPSDGLIHINWITMEISQTAF